MTDSLLGGWQIGGIINARTGLPVTVVDGRARSQQGERGSERPNCVGDWKPDDQTLDRWLDISGFEAAALGTFGNCEVGVARAPGYKNVDLVVSKRFPFGAERSGEFRVEAFNVFNIAELRAAGPRHQRSDQLRTHHQHDQRAASGGAGLQVLLLRRATGARDRG